MEVTVESVLLSLNGMVFGVCCLDSQGCFGPLLVASRLERLEGYRIWGFRLSWA